MQKITLSYLYQRNAWTKQDGSNVPGLFIFNHSYNASNLCQVNHIEPDILPVFYAIRLCFACKLASINDNAKLFYFKLCVKNSDFANILTTNDWFCRCF